jgi:hypothetical protein
MATLAPCELAEVSVVQLQELLAANEVWAMAVLDQTSATTATTKSPELQAILTEYTDVFSDPPLCHHVVRWIMQSLWSRHHNQSIRDLIDIRPYKKTKSNAK